MFGQYQFDPLKRWMLAAKVIHDAMQQIRHFRWTVLPPSSVEHFREGHPQLDVVHAIVVELVQQLPMVRLEEGLVLQEALHRIETALEIEPQLIGGSVSGSRRFQPHVDKRFQPYVERIDIILPLLAQLIDGSRLIFWTEVERSERLKTQTKEALWIR